MAETETELLVPRDRVTSDRTGAIVTLIAPDGVEWRGRVVRVEGSYALVRLFERLSLPTESPLNIALVQALPKKEKMSFIIQKATELGVTSIHPCTSSKSTSPEEAQNAQDKSHRWSDVARRAVDQCRRRTVPVVSPTVGFESVIDASFGLDALKLVLHEKERLMRLRDAVAATRRPSAVVLACGPEGGFSEDEVQSARDRGFVPVRLGGRILRCETAALASLTIIQYVWGDL